jgi:hypothetical protein
MYFDYRFNPGILSAVYLPENGESSSYTASFLTPLSAPGVTFLGGNSFKDCYGKYGIDWRWSTFTNTPSGIGVLSSTQTLYPSSWSTLQCLYSAGSLNSDNAGTYPKKWIREQPLSADKFNPFTHFCSATPITWTLSCSRWSVQQTIPLSVSNSFVFDLRYLNYGNEIYTANSFKPTNFTLNATISVTCFDLRTLQLPLTSEITLMTGTHSFTAFPLPIINLYTPNRLVLTGSSVNFENLITNIESVNEIYVDLDDGKTLLLNQQNVKNNFSVIYDITGYKTIKITLSALEGRIFNKNFTDIIQVLPFYDTVSPNEYRTADEILILPYQNQPAVGSNDWITDDNINNCFKQFYENLEYLDSRSKIYNNSPKEFFGYLGSIPSNLEEGNLSYKWTWEDADCLNSLLDYTITWRDFLSAESYIDNGKFFLSGLGVWENQECSSSVISPNCTGRGTLSGTDCVAWSWFARKSTSTDNLITWVDTASSNNYAKPWRFEICPSDLSIICDTGTWNVNIPGCDLFYPDYAVPSVQARCNYRSIISKENKLFLAQKTQVRLLSSDKNATFYNNRSSFDDVINFSNIECVRLDSEGKIFILDSILSQVAVYKFTPGALGGDWKLITNWGGAGSSKYRFSNPQDIHIDQLDNVWVTDTNNNSIKHYSNTGTWLKTIKDDDFKENGVLSVCVDSQKFLHVLTYKEIRVYSYEGNFLFAYDYSTSITTNTPRKINTSYNREIIYFATDRQVLKFFRNGVFCGYIIENKNDVYNITDIFHDEYRNLLITNNDKILKYVDIMEQIKLRGLRPSNYWSLNDIFIHKEEYIQNWVYTKSFQRMWDNIEFFRNSMFYSNTDVCKKYTLPIHSKDKMIIGQNEIVTSTTINRVMGYLWDNLITLLNYFDPNCKK